MKAAVIGVGAWGTALAKILADNGHDVVMWSHDAELARGINEDHENKVLFAGVELPANITSTTDLPAACEGAELILVVVASKFFGPTVQRLAELAPPNALIVSATKGLNPDTKKRPSEMLLEILPPERHDKIAVLSGPNIAREIAARKPAVTVIASPNSETARGAQKFFSTNYFRVYTNNDMTGTEYGGTLKNIIAIAAGILDGLELGTNAKSALMVRGQVENMRFALRFGAKPETLWGLAGMGDLITTCSSVMSRNYHVGSNLAKGKSLKDILSEMTAVAEGVETSKLIHEIATREGIDMPVTSQVHAVLFEDKPVREALEYLMTRELKAEH